EQQQLFELLLKRLDDDDQQVRDQAAYFLSLINDPRSEPLVTKTRKESAEKRLAAAPIKPVSRVWAAGPFADGDKGFQTTHAPEEIAIDLSAEYQGAGRKVGWKVMTRQSLFDFRAVYGPSPRSSY